MRILPLIYYIVRKNAKRERVEAVMRKKRNEKGTKQGLKSAVSKTFDIPMETFSNVSQLDILSNKEALLEGCKGILEYDDNIIRISGHKMEIKFTGEGLTLKCLTTENIMITGKIWSVEFIA